MSVAMVVLLSMSLLVSATASAFVGGGPKPSEAPLIAWGSHYEASLNDNKAEANYIPGCDCDDSYQVAIYHLGALNVHDQLVINWHALPFANSSGYPVRLSFVENVDDYTWGSTFGEEEGPPTFGLSGSGTARSEVTVKNSSTNDYLEFYAEANNTKEFETYLYDFSVEAPRHYLNMTISPFSEVAANGIVNASVTGANGLPGPDGLVYGLTVRWADGGIATYSATSSGGNVPFQLALPESVYKKNASFVVGRGADSSYMAVEAPVVHAKVTEPILPPTQPVITSACKNARSRVHVLARQHHRLVANSHRARGIRKVRLRRRAHRLGAELRSARSKAASVCA